MAYTCRLAITKLSQLLAAVSPESTVDVDETRALLAHAEELAIAIEAWHGSEPSADGKRQTIVDVLALRVRVAALTGETGA